MGKIFADEYKISCRDDEEYIVEEKSDFYLDKRFSLSKKLI